jgi:hypothetical protein
MNDEVIAKVQLIDVLDDIQSIMHDLTLDELDALIDEVKRLYEHYSNITNARAGDQ